MSFYRDGNFYGDGDFYGVSSSAPINLSYYYTDIDNVFVFSWTFNNPMFTPALATFDYELQLSLDSTFASPDFDYTSTSGIINSPGIAFQNGNVYKGFAVPVYTRIATPLTFYARVRIITSLLPAPTYGDWSDALIAQTLIDITQQEAHNLISNLPDRHVYPYDEAYKTVTRTTSHLSTNIGKVYWAYAREFDNANLEAQLADNDSDIFRARDPRFFEVFGYPTGFQKPSTMQWVDYRNIINEFRLACFAGSTMEAVKLVVASFAGVDPTITPFSQILNFILPMEEVETYTIPSFFPYTVTLANLPRNSPSILGYAFTDTLPIPANQYSAGTSISADFPSTNLTGTLTINLNGDGPQTITLGTDVTGTDIADDIQAKVRALIASAPINQPAYNNFTADYSITHPGLYTLTSGTTGTSSSVVVTGASDADLSHLKLGLAYGGTETIGTGSGSLAPGAANLASATGFAVLAATPDITSTGATVITGEVGIYPAASITGSPTIIGAEHPGDPAALAAQNDAQAAYTDLQGRTPTMPINTALTGTLTAGVYPYSSSVGLTGAVTLSGSATDIFIFQIASTLITASSSSVVLSGVLPQNVFWAVGTAVTFGTGTTFKGTVISEDLIADNGSSIITGRLISLTAAITLIATQVTVSGAGTAGTSVSYTSPATTLGVSLTINLNGDGPRTFNLGADTTGVAVAADIQTYIRSLTAVTPANQAAYTNFTASYDSLTGRYTLTSGTTGVSSTVVVTVGDILNLGMPPGIEAAGASVLGFFSANFSTGVLTFNAANAGQTITITYLDAANISSVLGNVVSSSTPVIYNRLAVGASVVITMNNPADFVIDPLSVEFLLDQIIPAHIEYILVRN